MVEVACVEELKSASVKVNSVLVCIVWVFALLFCICGKVYYSLNRVNRYNLFNMVFA